MKPTIFVFIETGNKDNPMQVGLLQLGERFGAEPVKQLVDEEVEADIAVTNSLGSALLWIKETKQTTFLLHYLNNKTGEEMRAFASRFPDRVFVATSAATEGEINLESLLESLIAQKATKKTL